MHISDFHSQFDSCNINFQFGDKRINKRANFMANVMVKNMAKSLPEIFCTSAELKGALRFLQNNLVNQEKILQPHINETIHRCKNEKLVAVIQDSTDLDFDYMECLEGFNPLHTHVDKGFRVHPNLLINEQGTPLGVLSTFNYTRKDTDLQKKHRNSLPIEEKESFRWLNGYREACKLAEHLPNIRVVSIADREGDIYECLKEAELVDNKRKADILVRSNHNRCLKDSNDETNNKLEKKLIRSNVYYEGKIVLNKYRKGERTADIVVRACQVTMLAPKTCKKKSLAPITLNAVSITEVDPPKGVEALSWLLLTTLPIDTVADIQLIASLYSKRWIIEIYFKVLKSGCKIDTPHLQSPEKIKNFIAFSMIIAWRVMLITYLPREYPNEPCSCMYTEVEWKIVFRAIEKGKPFPEDEPTLKEMTTYIAILGGYQKRKEPPGIQTVWRGIIRLMDMVNGYELTQGLTLSHKK